MVANMRILPLALAICASMFRVAVADQGGEQRAKSVGSCSDSGLFRTSDEKTPSGKVLQPTDVALGSRNNANDFYDVMITMPGKLSGNRHDRALLCIDGHAFVSGSAMAEAPHNVAFDFIGFDRATAETVEHLFHSVRPSRRDRHPLGQGLLGHFKMRTAHPRVGDALPIAIVLDNHGPDTVRFLDFRGRRGETNAYGVQIFLHGVQQPDVLPAESTSLHGGGGYLVSTISIRPGKSTAVTAVDLKEWAAFDKPGVYEVRCSFQRTLDGKDNSYWDFETTEIIHVEIFAN